MGDISNILAGIADPAVADISGAFKRGDQTKRQRLSREMVGQILGGTKAGKLGALAEADPQLGLAFAEKMGFFDSPLQQAQEFIGTVQFASATAKSGATKEANAILVEYRNRQAAIGLPTDKVDGIIQMMQQDPAQGTEALGLMNDAFVEQGLAKSPDVGKNINQIRKETRSRISGQLDVVRKDAKRVEDNFKKVLNLTENIKTGNRMAASQAVIALVKIGDDSTVREGELNTALANQNPTAAVFQFLVGEGVGEEVARAVSVKIDPFDPKFMKVGDILETADSLVTAQVPGIQSSFAESLELGEANLTKSGFRSVFSKTLTNRVGALSDLARTGPSGTKPLSDLSDVELDAQIKAAGGG